MELIHSEKQLLQRAAAGSQEAFAELFGLYRHKLYSFLLRSTGSPETTEDVIQDIFLRLWKDRGNLTNIEQFAPYIFRMAQNQVINSFKRMARETLILAELKQQTAEAPLAEDNLSLRELKERLQTAMEKLPPKQKLVFTLSRNEGLRHDEIARHLNISPSTVNNHMIEALRTIRRQLKTYLPALLACIQHFF
jgi:RNA polymerase sigma-70 factor (family 1)